MTTNEFSELIRKKRIELNLTQKELAQKLSISNKTISRWENERGYPDIELIPRLAKILELSYEELLDGNEYIAKKEKQAKKRNLIVIIIVLCLFLLMGYLWYVDTKEFESDYKNKDLLVSGEMINKVELDYQEPTEEANSMVTSLYIFDVDKSEALLQNLKVDHLVLVDNNKKNKISYNDVTWLATMHFNYHEDVVLKVHVYNIENKTYILFNQNSNYMQYNDGDLYYYDGLIPMGLEIFAHDVSSYDLSHYIKIKSELLQDVDQNKWLDILRRLSVESSFDLQERVIIANDQTNNKTYLVIVGKEKDYQDIIVAEDENKLKIRLNGDNVVYANTYCHIFELPQDYHEYDLFINKKRDYVLIVDI